MPSLLLFPAAVKCVTVHYLPSGRGCKGWQDKAALPPTPTPSLQTWRDRPKVGFTALADALLSCPAGAAFPYLGPDLPRINAVWKSDVGAGSVSSVPTPDGSDSHKINL